MESTSGRDHDDEPALYSRADSYMHVYTPYTDTRPGRVLTDTQLYVPTMHFARS